jgi:hypothetical protein
MKDTTNLLINYYISASLRLCVIIFSEALRFDSPETTIHGVCVANSYANKKEPKRVLFYLRHLLGESPSDQQHPVASLQAAYALRGASMRRNYLRQGLRLGFFFRIASVRFP